MEILHSISMLALFHIYVLICVYFLLRGQNYFTHVEW